MNPLGDNPFAVLTFIVAPAVLTNASSVMGLQTANRFARAIDRARVLAIEIKGREKESSPEIQLRWQQLAFAERRALLLVRSMTAFYLSVGSFAGASFASLLGAVFVLSQLPLLHIIALWVALGCGVTGVGGLLTGSALLVWETRLALVILHAETTFLLRSRPDDAPPGAHFG